ncbi:MAG: ABC transporter ATP-binding protein [Lentihominibacter sp.]
MNAVRTERPAIKTEGLTKYYGKSRGITDLDLTVKRGEFFGYIGPNGAGKSTTIRILTGLIKRTGGRAEVLGMDPEADKEAILANVGYLPSEAVFYQGLKVKDIIRLSADLRKIDCSNEAEKLCERLRLDRNKKISELSFGNRKKVAIVCALQHKPELYILDEPTGGLDPLMQREFFTILKERNRDGATIFLSSHILSEVQQHCGRAAIIREGRIIACDNVSELTRANARRIKVRTGSVSSDDNNRLMDIICRLNAVRDVKQHDDGADFLYGGDINELIRGLSDVRLADLDISEPELDEIFMHYYQDGGEA